jgi:hypothetical protein
VRTNLRLLVTALALTLLAACVRSADGDKAPARQSPVAVPSASASASSEGEATLPVDIDPETGETLGLRATATVSISLGGTSTTDSLVQSEMTDSALEQTAGETKRVLRLSTADTARADDVQFTIDGEASVGNHKTGDRGLKVVFYNATRGVDVLSDNGSCTVAFSKVDVTGIAGTVTCPGITLEKGTAQLSAAFSAEAL